MNIRSRNLKSVFCLLLASVSIQLASAQYVYKIKADTVRIYNTCDSSAELVLQNRTQNVLGYLYNKGGGVTEFRALNTIDSVYKSNDTLYCRLPSGEIVSIKIGASGQANTLYSADGSITSPRVVDGNSTGTLTWNNFSSIQSHTVMGIINTASDMSATTAQETITPTHTTQWVQNSNTSNGYGFPRAGLRIDTISGVVLGDDPEASTTSSKAGRIGIDKTGIYFTKSMNKAAHEMRDSAWFSSNSDTTKIFTPKVVINSSISITQNAGITKAGGAPSTLANILTVTGGIGGATTGTTGAGPGGAIAMTTGKGGSVIGTSIGRAARGANFTITAGDGGDNPNSGDVGAGGDIAIKAGNTGAAPSGVTVNSRGGIITLKGGISANGTTDIVSPAGWVDIQAGDATTGYGGNVSISGGAGTTRPGDVYLGAYMSPLGIGTPRGHVYVGFAPPILPGIPGDPALGVAGLTYTSRQAVGRVWVLNTNYADAFAGSILELQQISDNRNHTVDFSFTSFAPGQLVYIHNANSGQYTWSIIGSVPVQLPDGTAITTLANRALYTGYFDGTILILRP